MNRRNALKRTAFLIGSATTFTTLGVVTQGCDSGPEVDWTSLSDPYIQSLLAEISETFLPATEEPGAKELGVHHYVTRLLTDCYEKEVQQSFLLGLKQLEEACDKSFGNTFNTCTPDEREEILTGIDGMPNEKGELDALKSFYPLMKRLTIEGYMKSEYVVTNVLKYKLVPGPYVACAPVGTAS
ncbi:MAG: gluconate 2-dehydrogenase subunit 3 family protein [Cyclobacteriaceae bacterium]|nr:gluconate 2-dehydrogenase subunit 3 family protein [Cyclobacteriaceae bacterium]